MKFFIFVFLAITAAIVNGRPTETGNFKLIQLERERERERDRQKEIQRQRKRVREK